MNFPWVGRLAYDNMASERDHLRRENAKLTEALTRINRREVGLPETPREARAPVEPMPRRLLDYCNSFAGTNIQKAQRDVAYRRHAQGETWDHIEADVMAGEDK